MAVYTEISNTDLEEYLTQYDIGELHSLKGIAEGVENSNYLLSTDAGMYILTLYEKRVRPEDLPFFLGLMDHLAGKGFACPQAIRMKTGESLGELSGRPSAIISFLDGNSVKRPTSDHCEQLGMMLAKMHLAGEGFQIKRGNSLGLKDWRPLYLMSKGEAELAFPRIEATIETELSFLESAWPQSLPTGVVHADLFPDNVFFLKGELSGFIDFYFACNDLLAYDIATCINAWCFESDYLFNVTKAKRFLRGYQSIRELLLEEKQSLPILCRGSALRFLLTRLFDWLNVPAGALVVPKDPSEYIAKLRFHKSITSSAEYGLE